MGGKRLNRDGFIEKATSIHGDKFDYSLVEFVNTFTKVKIRCIKHDEIFEQTPSMHYKHNGCRSCFSECVIERQLSNTNEFITNAKLVHGDTYEYHKTIYKHNRLPVIITCKKHGDFEQVANNHLAGHGCRKCAAEFLSSSQANSVEQFIENARKIHGDYYSYDLVVYKNTATKVKIICPVHGVFEQIPCNHTSGQKCPLCSIRGFKSDLQSHVYVLKVEGMAFSFTGYGISNDIEARLAEHKRNLRKHGLFIEDFSTFYFDSGAAAEKVESCIRSIFERHPLTLNLRGFKTESTTTDYATVVAFVQDYITKNTQ